MKRKLRFGALAAGLALLATGCFSLQGFSVKDSSLSPGQKTKIQFVERPTAPSVKDKAYQFVLIGVSKTSDLGLGKAVWGTNGKFAGPLTMASSVPLASSATAPGKCSASGLDVSSVTGVTWKAYVTPIKVADKGKVDQVAITQVNATAKKTATPDDLVTVIGVSGAWYDSTSTGTVGVPDTTDSFLCNGLATVSVYVKAS
jgi:hypothetical protein